MATEAAPSSADDTAKTARRDISDHKLTTLAGVRSYLEQHQGRTGFDLQALAGGTANYVYRVTDHDTGAIHVLKHAAPQLASNPAFGLSTERMDFEANMLMRKALDEGECTHVHTEKTHVHTVPFVSYDNDVKLLCVGDGGDRNLKDAYAHLSPDEIQDIGTELGKWLANLHGATPLSYVAAIGADSEARNNPVGVAIAGYTYRHLADAIKTYGGTTAKAETISNQVNTYSGDLIVSDKECVCHGDFWPGNIMLRSNTASQTHVLTVVDWELTRIGTSATDIGQFAAEAAMLDRFHGNKGLRAAFMRAYFQTSGASHGAKKTLVPWLTRIAMHYAVHLVVWPGRAVHWAPPEAAAMLADHGLAVLADAVSKTPDLGTWTLFDGLRGAEGGAGEMMEVAR
ncbi:uncharacterized protein M421DRAFT_52032 [Didymella exigua CBS 183.55]|uniref:Aminoglycoside phosphotransferase domain-containing protein n=1 Tax=Didymella exigua CBS 183.55 TaxID=1150837 RepID=A0A6A5S073_9PLEO|nr:uncharacterized protein M421DRAFT_52032 [Didymella exigua CBS 183.55]KAF1933522.1 hypothetical protein M421DRAFT_52032 [Didymella exigua CBS 183.55]